MLLFVRSAKTYAVLAPHAGVRMCLNEIFFKNVEGIGSLKPKTDLLIFSTYVFFSGRCVCLLLPASVSVCVCGLCTAYGHMFMFVRFFSKYIIGSLKTKIIHYFF